jgi:hypothetical protein
MCVRFVFDENNPSYIRASLVQHFVKLFHKKQITKFVLILLALKLSILFWTNLALSEYVLSDIIYRNLITFHVFLSIFSPYILYYLRLQDRYEFPLLV